MRMGSLGCVSAMMTGSVLLMHTMTCVARPPESLSHYLAASSVIAIATPQRRRLRLFLVDRSTSLVQPGCRLRVVACGAVDRQAAVKIASPRR